MRRLYARILPKQLRHFSLEVAAQGGVGQAREQAGVLFAQVGQFRRERVWRRRFGSAWLWSEWVELARRAQAPPVEQMRGVHSFASEYGSDLALLCPGVGLLHDRSFLGSREGPARGIRQHLRVWWRRCRLLGNDE